MGVLFAPIWEDAWRERCLFRLAEHLVERHLGRFGAWPRAAFGRDHPCARSVEPRGLFMRRDASSVSSSSRDTLDALLLRNQQEHFSTQRVSSLYLLSVILQAIFRPRIGREPSFVIPALLAAQEFYFAHAVGDGLCTENPHKNAGSRSACGVLVLGWVNKSPSMGTISSKPKPPLHIGARRTMRCCFRGRDVWGLNLFCGWCV
jgi:hypothetical protein